MRFSLNDWVLRLIGLSHYLTHRSQTWCRKLSLTSWSTDLMGGERCFFCLLCFIRGIYIYMYSGGMVAPVVGILYSCLWQNLDHAGDRWSIFSQEVRHQQESHHGEIQHSLQYWWVKRLDHLHSKCIQILPMTSQHQHILCIFMFVQCVHFAENTEHHKT